MNRRNWLTSIIAGAVSAVIPWKTKSVIDTKKFIADFDARIYRDGGVWYRVLPPGTKIELNFSQCRLNESPRDV